LVDVTADDLEQRRFAGAVAPDDRHALARVELQRDVLQQRQVPVGVVDVIESQ
jgi:hypothetical protein